MTQRRRDTRISDLAACSAKVKKTEKRTLEVPVSNTIETLLTAWSMYSSPPIIKSRSRELISTKKLRKFLWNKSKHGLCLRLSMVIMKLWLKRKELGLRTCLRSKIKKSFTAICTRKHILFRAKPFYRSPKLIWTTLVCVK